MGATPTKRTFDQLVAAAQDEPGNGLRTLWAKLLAAMFDPARTGIQADFRSRLKSARQMPPSRRSARRWVLVDTIAFEYHSVFAEKGAKVSDSTEGLTFAVCYFLPTIFAFVRKVPDKWACFWFNLITGITILGWFFAWVYPFPVLRRYFQGFVRVFAGGLIKYGNTGAMPSPRPLAGSAGAPRQSVCPNGADGRMRCPQCLGKGTWYEPPTTANGAPLLIRCPYCLGNGTVQCTLCGGTGRAS